MTTPASSPVRQKLWRGPQIVLASRSAGRARLLEGAGIPFIVVESNLDERQVEAEFQGAPKELASRLAFEKARLVAGAHRDRLVLAGDQVLSIGDRVLHKPETMEQAVAQLRDLRGCEHNLHSAATLVTNGVASFDHVETAQVRLSDFSDSFLRAYVDVMGERMLRTVGAYEIEGMGANLIEKVQGDFFTIVGFPLLPFLAYCRRVGLIAGESE